MSDKDPQAWIAKAENDILSIENNLRGQHVPWEVVAFHAQQAVEKYLKGWLVARGKDYPKVHDLNYLLEVCVNSGADFGALLRDCSRLTVFSVRFRYPGPGSDVLETEGREAVEAARRVLDVLRTKF